MKKLISVTTGLIIALSSNMNIDAMERKTFEQNESYMADNFKIQNESTYDIKVNPYDIDAVEKIIKTLDVMPETARAMREYSQKCIKGIINDGEMQLTTKYNPYNKAIRYYIGFKNKKYMEETLTLKNTSSSAVINKGTNYSGYLNKVMTALVNTGLSYITNGSWTIAEILGSSLPSGVPSNSEFRHEARLVENKVQKYTYIEANVGESYTFGSREEKSTFYFNNEVIYPGYSPKKTGNTKSGTIYTKGYDKTDEMAYYGYVNGGNVQRIFDFKYGGIKFNSIV